MYSLKTIQKKSSQSYFFVENLIYINQIKFDVKFSHKIQEIGFESPIYELFFYNWFTSRMIQIQTT